MEEKIWKAAIAGLLHDVGKLEQRAQDNPWQPAPGFDKEGQPVHATWTGYFIQHSVPDAYRPAALHGIYHHAPEKSPAEDHSLSFLIELADKLSAGERSDAPQGGKQKDPPQQMVTIFDRLQLAGAAKAEHFLPLKPLALQESVLFPVEKIDAAARTHSYAALCKELRSAASQEIEDPEAYIENLLGALQRTSWCVPSAYYHAVPDVSLYDHSRMTAALAVCLAEPDVKVDELLKAVEADFSGKYDPAQQARLEQPAALLIGGDISGIQDFIYTISSKNAAKTLRGRSFYLQLLTEAVLRFVLSELGLPYVNVIYAGGGHFYLLAPLSAAGKLAGVRKAVTEKLVRHHGVSLYLAIGSSEIPFSGFRIGQFPRYWGEMHRSLSAAKQRRYLELGDDFYAHVFAVPEHGGNPTATCSVCGDDHRKTSPLEEETRDGEEAQAARICSLCASFDEQIGKSLPGSQFIALGIGKPTETRPGFAADALAAFGMSFQLIEKASEKINLPKADRVVVWALGDPHQGQWPAAQGVSQANLLHYTVNRKPASTFDELQKKVDGGFEKLGVLRMDVDNLGDLFAFGFGKPDDKTSLATLARLSTLSFQVSLFFEGWVKHLSEQYPDKIYAVYAGGDDLFLIGPWDIMPGFAHQVYSDFKRYTGQHPALHISGGMAFIGGKYPVYQAARDAEDAERLAKNSGKDAFGFLGEAWKWADFVQLTRMQERLAALVTKGDSQGEAGGLGGPTSILQNLRNLANLQAESKEKYGRPLWGRWMWLSAYQFKRLADMNSKNKPEVSAELTAIQNDLEVTNYQNIHQWGIAARWAQLKTRGKHE